MSELLLQKNNQLLLTNQSWSFNSTVVGLIFNIQTKFIVKKIHGYIIIHSRNLAFSEFSCQPPCASYITFVYSLPFSACVKASKQRRSHMYFFHSVPVLCMLAILDRITLDSLECWVTWRCSVPGAEGSVEVDHAAWMISLTKDLQGSRFAIFSFSFFSFQKGTLHSQQNIQHVQFISACFSWHNWSLRYTVSTF